MHRLFACCLLALTLGLEALDVGDAAPVLRGVTWVQGTGVDYAGKVTVVEFWATWCGPCRESIPHLTELQKRFGDQVAVIGLSNEPEPTVRPFLASMGPAMAYRVGVVAPTDQAAWMAGRDGIPHAFLLDGTGHVVWTGHPSLLEHPLELLLAGHWNAGLGKQLAVAEARMGVALQGAQRGGSVAELEQAVSAVRAIDPVHPQAIEIALLIAQQQQRPLAARAILEDLPLDQVPASLANNLAHGQAVIDDLRFANLDLAMRLSERAIALEPRNAVYLATRARVLWAAGLNDQAIVQQQRAVEAAINDPQHADALRTYAQIMGQREAILRQAQAVQK